MVFKRIRDIVVASVNDGLDKVENPVVMLNQYLRDMETELAKAKDAVVKQQMIERGFEKQMEQAIEKTSKRQRQARLAFDAGEEQLARKALGEMKHYEAKVNYYKDLYQKASQQVAELKSQLEELQEKFQQLKDQKHALVARANAARAKEHMQHSMENVHSESAFTEFQRLEDRIMEMELRVDTGYTSQWSSDHSNNMHLEYADDVEHEIEKMRQAKTKRDDTALDEA